MTTNSIAFISGAAGGLGQAAAELFHSQGYQLWLTDVDQQGLDKLQALYPNAIIDRTDLVNDEQLEALCHKLESSSHNIELAYINAGVSYPGKIVDTSRRDIDLQLNINMRSACHFNHALARKMKAQSNGHIINTLSTAAMISLPEGAAYSASKFGLRGFVIALAAELKPYGVTVSGIYPNAIDTPMLRYEAVNGGSALNFLDEPVTPDDIIKAIQKAQRGKKLEYFVPAKDTLTAKLICAFPGILNRLYPLLEGMGEKGRQKYISSRGL